VSSESAVITPILLRWFCATYAIPVFIAAPTPCLWGGKDRCSYLRYLSNISLWSLELPSLTTTIFCIPPAFISCTVELGPWVGLKQEWSRWLNNWGMLLRVILFHKTNKTDFYVYRRSCFSIEILAYVNHFDNGFHFDDGHTIEDNPYIKSIKNVPLFFMTQRPLVLPHSINPQASFGDDIPPGTLACRRIEPLYFHIRPFYCSSSMYPFVFIFLKVLANDRYFALLPQLFMRCIQRWQKRWIT